MRNSGGTWPLSKKSLGDLRTTTPPERAQRPRCLSASASELGGGPRKRKRRGANQGGKTPRAAERSQAAVVSRYRSGCTRLAHQVENGLALHYHQTGSVMIASASPPKKELMQKNIRMSSTLVITRPLLIRRDHGGAKGPFLQSVVGGGVSRSLRPRLNFHATR